MFCNAIKLFGYSLLFVSVFFTNAGECGSDSSIPEPPPPLKLDGTSFESVPSSMTFDYFIKKNEISTYPTSCVPKVSEASESFCFGPCREEYFIESKKRGRNISVASVSAMDGRELFEELDKFRNENRKTDGQNESNKNNENNTINESNQKRIISEKTLKTLLNTLPQKEIFLIKIENESDKSRFEIPGTIALKSLLDGNFQTEKIKDFIVVMYGESPLCQYPFEVQKKLYEKGFHNTIFFQDGTSGWLESK
ncbi:MAG: hypothetical protein HQM10_13195 [Candidatus Riflebacteria bacterium]|nr:hypothetical protein [Candidatus Riflebacteria bacterium]